MAAAGSSPSASLIKFPIRNSAMFPRRWQRASNAAPRICYKSGYASGDSPLRLLNEAANRIGAGEINVAAIAGGEALRTAARRVASAAPSGASARNAAPAAPNGASTDNAVRAVALRRGPSYRHRYGLVAPVDVYPLYENAGRAAYGQTLAQGQAESAAIWSRFSEVAEGNPGAWLRRRVSADEIMTVSAANRPIAFPYSKLMVANSSVNQGAAFIVTSLSEARARGISDDRLMFVGKGAAAQEPVDLMARANYVESPSMTVSMRKALELNGLATADLDYAELYSCFPCVPKMARRVIGWPLERAGQRFRRPDFRRRACGQLHESCGGEHGVGVASKRPARFAVRQRRTGHAESFDRLEPRAPGTEYFSAEFRFSGGGGCAARAGAAHSRGLSRARNGGDLHRALQSRRLRRSTARSSDAHRMARASLPKFPADDAATIHWLTSGEEEPVGRPGAAVRGADGDTWWVRPRPVR